MSRICADLSVVDKQNEEELVERWRRGDGSAFEELVRRWQDSVARFLTHYVGEPDVIEDLCQEVFLRVYLNRQRYRTTGAFSTWVYRIALNVARDHARRQKRRRHQSLDDHEPAEDRDSVEAECWRSERAALVTDALAELPDALRLVVVLRHYEKLSFAEMSRLLHTPASTLKSRFLTALKHLRTSLLQRGWVPEEDD